MIKRFVNTSPYKNLTSTLTKKIKSIISVQIEYRPQFNATLVFLLNNISIDSISYTMRKKRRILNNKIFINALINYLNHIENF